MTVSAPPNRPRTGDRDLARDVDRRGRVVPPGPGERAVHPDHAGQPEPERPGQERHPATHAEAQREHRPGRGPAVLRRPDLLDRGGDVGLDAGPGRLDRMGAVVEVIAARLRSGGPAEPVERQRVDPVLGEAEGQLLVIRMQPANVGQDHDTSPG